MGAVAELYSVDGQDRFAEPVAVIVPGMPEDVFSRHKADRLIRAAGAAIVEAVVAVEAEVADSPELADDMPVHFDTMMDALHAAARGCETGKSVISINAKTDITERTLKAGHVIDVALDVRSDGKVVQYGQTADSIAMNTLRYASDVPQMRARAEAETRNNVRIEDVNRQGLLEDNFFVVFSRYADDMSTAEAAKAGFFTGTQSCAIQVTTAFGSGLVMESAFVAGVKDGGTPHDAQAVCAIAKQFGVSYDGLSATQTIDTPMLIPKHLMPNGVVDVVRMYDEAAGGTFFGQAKPAQDYLEYREYCRQRQADFEPVVETIVDEMISRADSVRTPLEAVQLLNDLSQREMVDVAIYDDTIDALVFGGEAAGFIEQARLLRGDIDQQQFMQIREKAQQTAESYSCPSGTSKASLAEAAQAESDDWHGGKILRNKACRSCKVTKPEIGACHVCQDCTKNPAKMQAAYDREMKARIVSIAELASNLLAGRRASAEVAQPAAA